MNKLIYLYLAILSISSCFAKEIRPENFLEHIAGNYSVDLNQDKEISLIVWNLYMLKKIDITKFQQSDLYSKMLNADILLFQEIISKSSFTQEALGLEDFYFTQIPYLKIKRHKIIPDSINNGLANISKPKPLSTKLVIGKAMDLADGTRSVALISNFSIQNSDQILKVIHVHNGVSIFRTMNLMKKLTPEITAHKGPLIIAGDFNSFLLKSKFVKEWARKKKMNDSNVSTPYKFGVISFGQLDHAFYRGLALSEKVKVLKETNYLSDHIGYSLKFKILETY